MYGRSQEPMALCNKNTELCPSLFSFKLAMKDAKSLPIFVSAGFIIPVMNFRFAGFQYGASVKIIAVLVVVALIFHGDRQIVLAFEFNVNVSSCHQKRTLTSIRCNFVLFVHDALPLLLLHRFAALI